MVVDAAATPTSVSNIGLAKTGPTRLLAPALQGMYEMCGRMHPNQLSCWPVIPFIISLHYDHPHFSGSYKFAYKTLGLQGGGQQIMCIDISVGTIRVYLLAVAYQGFIIKVLATGGSLSRPRIMGQLNNM